MIKEIIFKPWTQHLVKTLDSFAPLPDPDKVTKLLKFGANPWGTNDNGRSVLSFLVCRCPYPQAVDAWFDAAGDLSKAPWKKQGTCSPLMDVLEEVGQPDMFRKKLLLRMIENNVSPKGADLPGHSLIERIWWRIPDHAVELINLLVEKQPELATTHAAQAFIRERRPADLLKLSTALTSVQAGYLRQETATVTQISAKKPRL